jgi:hypothetical protein
MFAIRRLWKMSSEFVGAQPSHFKDDFAEGLALGEYAVGFRRLIQRKRSMDHGFKQSLARHTQDNPNLVVVGSSASNDLVLGSEQLNEVKGDNFSRMPPTNCNSPTRRKRQQRALKDIAPNVLKNHVYPMSVREVPDCACDVGGRVIHDVIRALSSRQFELCI